ncbi:recombinase family protein [Azospirillum sp. B21]|nr:recombinase family protein [Azospirillum sp. B21]MDR6774758.1 site-specific DNA recombinase [Azospirillum sp. BE72]
MRAAIYARVSTERQERQQTIDSQLAALRAWADAGAHELRDCHIFRDEGYSGARLDRPGLDGLRDAVRDGEVEVVAILAPDRLSRRYAYQVLVLEEFRRAGCAVAFLNHAISDDPGDQLLLQIQGAVAEYERALLSERFRRGKLQKARAGQFIGVHAPYGYRYLPRQEKSAGRLIVDETEVETVRQLYAWLTEERMTLRQILKRLNFGPWFPRCGRRPWSPSTVHHILSDPVYIGTAYSNRYEYVPAKKPRSRKPSYRGVGCRRLRPKEDWIAIAVPIIIEQETGERAQAQLARNAALSFRNNTKYDYLLRCLLTCSACGLAMYGITRHLAGNIERHYYYCAGKDCVMTARAQRCPRAGVKGADLDGAVWDHVRTLLGNPERLAAQFQQFVGDADRSAAQEAKDEARILTRQNGLNQADRRLLDAYQAEVISLEELTERRQQLADQRRALDHQLEQQRDLRRQRTKAQEIFTDLTAFCERIHGRLETASFADKQAIVQLVIERIIVHDDHLEIRHVIPLHNPPPGRGPIPAAGPNGRLCSDRVNAAPLECRPQHLGSGGLQPEMRVGDHQFHPAQTPAGERAQELGPEGLGF